jgi:hypothetical protein
MDIGVFPVLEKAQLSIGTYLDIEKGGICPSLGISTDTYVLHVCSL